MFGVYALLALIVAGLSLLLSPQVEAPRSVLVQVKGAWQRLVPPLGPSRGIIMGLAGLFCVDALAGGLVVQSLMVLFFHLRFGLLNTMVFTHLPSNVLLILVAFAPTFPLAAAILLLRQGLSQMDVPTGTIARARTAFHPRRDTQICL